MSPSWRVAFSLWHLVITEPTVVARSCSRRIRLVGVNVVIRYDDLFMNTQMIFNIDDPCLYCLKILVKLRPYLLTMTYLGLKP